MWYDSSLRYERLTQRINLIQSRQFVQRERLAPFEYAGLPDASVVNSATMPDVSWQHIPYHTYWGTWQTNFLLRSHYDIPDNWPVGGLLALYLPLGDADDAFKVHPEALIYIDDEIIAATDSRHQLIHLPEHCTTPDRHHLLLHGWTGLGGSLWGDDRPRLYLQACYVVQLHPGVRQLVALAQTALSACQHLPDDNLVTQQLLPALDDALQQVDTRHPLEDAFYESISGAYETLQQAVTGIGEPHPVTMHATGHAHLDTAWLWTLAQTRRKAQRTFYTALHLMKQDSTYHFTQSQPQLYEFIRQDDPALFASIKEAVERGQWEPTGGMWVEADCNLSGAESLVRQFLLGRRYLQKHFGEAETPVLWLPDTFGFPHTLPQLANEAGIRYFFTTKLRWSEHNQIPYDSFWWQGPDGSRLLAHLTPTPMQEWWRIPTYNAEANAQAAIETWQTMRQKSTVRRALMVYGHGDGGGGPTAGMLDNIRVLGDFPGVPHVTQSSAYAFFQHLEDDYGETLPVWDDELYLETHQGTFTSQAWIKKANRDTEALLHDVEFLATYAMLIDDDYVYPQEAINVAWRTLCLNQFHDILPGSSIAEVYDDARQQFADLTDSMTRHRDEALSRLADYIGGDYIVVNTTDVTGAAPVLLKEGLPDGYHSGMITQVVDEGTLLATTYPVMPFSADSLMLFTSDNHPPAPAENKFTVTKNRLEGTHLRVEFNKAGDITRIYDKRAGQDVLQAGQTGNQFQLFEDRPRHFDAWNIDPDYERQMWTAEPAHSIEVTETGPIRATLTIKRRAMNSVITQHISLYAAHLGIERLDFRTHIDWQERQMLLKVAFPVSVQADEATYQIQWGAIKRPTTRNTRWQQAKYEVPAHGWAKLSDGQYAIALLNDCKYGYDIHENVMRLTLLKSPTYPDPDADRGEHEFTYSLLAYTGSSDADIITHWQTRMLHHPLLVYKSDSPRTDNQLFPLISVSHQTSSAPFIETIKKAEDSNGIIIRLYHPGATTESIQAEFGIPVRSVKRVNILEVPQETYEVRNSRRIAFEMKPHEIITLLVEPEPDV